MQLVLSAAQFINSAVAATTSSYTSQCMNDYVPKEADLVLVEFSVNDWEVIDAQTFTWMDNSLRWGSCLFLKVCEGYSVLRTPHSPFACHRPAALPSAFEYPQALHIEG